MGKETLHIAILPWLALGHLIPFLQLAIALATAGLRISFLSTPKNIRRLPQVPNHLISLISFIELSLPSVDGLPQHCESTNDVSLEESQHLKTAYDLLQTPIKQFLTDSSPDWIIYDFAAYWTGAIATECRVQSVHFSTFSAAIMAFFGPMEALTEDGRRRCWPSPESLTLKPEWVPFPSKVAFQRREAEGFFSIFFGANASGVSDVDRVRLAAEGCDAIAARSCNEFEGEYLELLGKFYDKPVLPVGLLPPVMPSSDYKGSVMNGGDSWSSIFRWLDEQEPKSVVFVSFGSEYKFTKSELHELSHGLELSNVPFLWAIRSPDWLSTGQVEEALPQGFTEQTKGRGLTKIGWAPQLEILAHPSVGGSLFHCGFGSIVETLRCGHALILSPLIFDQGLNARFLVEKGLAIEVERNEDGSFNRDEIARSLRTAMVSDEGEKLRLKAREMGATFADQALHDQYVRRFVDYLFKARSKSAT